jgi:DNA-binding NarL/FixJ family response regulator
MRKIVVRQGVIPKSVFVVSDAPSVRVGVREIRELGYKCTVVGSISTAMMFLRDGARVHVLVVDLKSTTSAEKLVRWVREHRPEIRVICVHNDAMAADVPDELRKILEPANLPGILK